MSQADEPTAAEWPGERGSQDLFAALYNDLHRLADRALRRVGALATLSPTSVLHEAYLDFSARDSSPFRDQGHFMAYASRAMRGIIIDYARRDRAQKRGGGFEITSLPTELPELRVDGEELARLAEGLEELACVDARLVEVVDLKYFCGFSFGEIAAMRNVSERTVQRDWEKARILLHRSLTNLTLAE